MKGLAVAVGGGALASTAVAAGGGPPSQLAEQYDRVVDVAAAGADTDGEQSITPVLREQRADDTLYYFPPGRYYMDEQFRFTGFDNVGFYGEDATLVPADYHSIADGSHKLFRLGVSYNPGHRLHVEGFTVDMTADDTGVRAFEASVAEHLVVRDVTVNGRHDSGKWGPGWFALTEPDAEGLVERFRAPDGGEYSANAPGDLWRGPTGILCNQNKGQLTIRDCELGGFPDNGLYGAGSDGPIRVEGGLFKNSNGANVRLGGSGSEIVDVRVVVDRSWAETRSQRGIRVEKTDDIAIRDSYVHNSVDTPNSHGVSIQWDARSATVENTAVVMDGSEFNYGVYAAPRTEEVVVRDTEVVQETPGGPAFFLSGQGVDSERASLENVTITGSPGHEYNRAAIYNERSNVTLSNVTVDQTGGDMRRGLENKGDDCRIVGSAFTVPERPVVDAASGTVVENSSFESRGGYCGYHLTDDAEAVTLRENVIVNGIRDDGATDPVMEGNRIDWFAPGETGTVATRQSGRDQWHDVSLHGRYDDPVVVMKPLSANGYEPAHVRLRDVEPSSFSFQFEEWGYLDGGHTTETPDYVVMDAGVYGSDDTHVEADTVYMNEGTAEISFEQSFDSRPVVLTQVQTYHGSDPVVTRVEHVGPRGAVVELTESEADGPHTVERVGYVALEQGAGELAGVPFEANRTDKTVTDAWHRIDFENRYDSPRFIADLQSVVGTDPAALRYRNLTSTGVEVRVEEERSANDETSHVAEAVGYVVTEG